MFPLSLSPEVEPYVNNEMMEIFTSVCLKGNWRFQYQNTSVLLRFLKVYCKKDRDKFSLSLDFPVTFKPSYHTLHCSHVASSCLIFWKKKKNKKNKETNNNNKKTRSNHPPIKR